CQREGRRRVRRHRDRVTDLAGEGAFRSIGIVSGDGIEIDGTAGQGCGGYGRHDSHVESIGVSLTGSALVEAVPGNLDVKSGIPGQSHTAGIASRSLDLERGRCHSGALQAIRGNWTAGAGGIGESK